MAGLLVIVSLLVVVPLVSGEDDEKPPLPRTPTELPDHFEMDFVAPGTGADRNGDGIIWSKPVHGGDPPPGWYAPGWVKHEREVPLMWYVTIDNNGQYARAPDLVVESHTLSPAHPTTADEITFTVVVKNIGRVTAGPSTLLFRIGGEWMGTEFSVPSLGPDQTHTVQRKTRLVRPGAYLNTITVDVHDDVVESNEDNNVRKYSYTVSG